MPRARRRIIIDRPVAHVFAFFSDPSNDLKWRTHAKEIAQTASASRVEDSSGHRRPGSPRHPG